MKIGEPRSPDCNDCEQFAWDESQVIMCMNVCVNNIVLLVTVSRYAIHHDNIYLTRWMTSYCFEQLHLNFVLHIALEKDT